MPVIKLVNESDNKAFVYATDRASGFDISANHDESINPGEIKLIKTGLFVDMSDVPNLELQIRPRSGLALKNGITVLNSPGTVDNDYRGEIGVILINHSNTTFNVTKGMKIAQGVFSNFVNPSVNTELIVFDLVDKNELSSSDRGNNGFGSTGV